MKIRQGFVSNSSSSSFVIYLSDITAEQLSKILNHAEEGEKLGIEHAREWAWDVRTSDGCVGGSTYLDNFDMGEFFARIGVPFDKVKWGD